MSLLHTAISSDPTNIFKEKFQQQTKISNLDPKGVKEQFDFANVTIQLPRVLSSARIFFLLNC